jgi:ribonuclease Z
VRAAVIEEIERQASEAWGMGKAVAAVDYMQVVIPAGTETTNEAEPEPSDTGGGGAYTTRGLRGRGRRGGRRHHGFRRFTHREPVASVSYQDPS